MYDAMMFLKSIFEDDGTYYPQLFLETYLYEFTEWIIPIN